MRRTWWRAANFWLVAATALSLLQAQESSTIQVQSSRETSPQRLIRYSGALLLEPNIPGKSLAVRFALFESATSSAELWGETHSVTVDATGRYQVLLGSTTVDGIPLEPFQGTAARWLEVRVVESGKTYPRVRLVSVPYALSAEDARTLGGRLPAEYALKSDLATTRQAMVPDIGPGLPDAMYSPDKPSPAFILRWPGSETQVIKQGKGSELQVNRFEGIRFADQFDSVQDAINDLPESGGTVVIPSGTYILAAPLNPQKKSVILQGQGWRSTTSAQPFGGNWPDRVTGTILRVTGTNDALVVGDTAHYNGRLVVRDLFILGPGNGTSVGFYKKNSAFYGISVVFQNVGIANFHTNMKFENLLYSTFDNMLIGGGVIGIHVPPAPVGAANALSFRDVRFGGNTTVAQIESGQGWTWEGRNSVEGNTNGLLFKSDPATPQSLAMVHKGFWFEGNTNYDIKIDANANSISGIEFHDGRCSNGGNKIQIVGSGVYAANSLVFRGMDCAGVDLVIPAFSANTQVQGGRFASYTDNGQNTLKLGGSPATAADIRLGADRAIVGPAGQAYISGNAAGWVRQGYYGTSATKRHDLRAGIFNLFTTDDVLRFAVTAGANRHYNAQDLYFYSDNGNTLTAQIFGATGNVSSTGRANFNKGICHNSEQTICDTAGVGPPSGSCVTGSTYRRLDGGQATTLYVCENTSWAVVAGQLGTPETLQLVQTFEGAQVTTGHLQCFRSTEGIAVGDCSGSAINFIGVATSATNTNPVIVQNSGIVVVHFEVAASPAAGWHACSSTGGKVAVQADSCSPGRQVGIIAQGGTSLTSGKVFLQPR